MPPPKKRRIAPTTDETTTTAAPAPAVAALEMPNSSSSIISLDTALVTIDTTVASLLEASQTLVSGDSVSIKPLQTQLLQLKALQHNLLDAHDSATAQYDKQQARQRQQRKRLAALEYEQAYLERELQASEHFATPYLEQLVRSETTDDNNDADAGGPLDSMMRAFFGNNNNSDQPQQVLLDDPAQRSAIVAQLHAVMNERGHLSRDVQLVHQRTELETQRLQLARKFLSSLPAQLERVEKSSKTLQSFMQSSHPATGSPHKLVIGTDRAQRLEQARVLPPNMYTLFAGLQDYLDFGCSSAMDVMDKNDSNDEVQSTLSIDDHHKLQWHLTVPVMPGQDQGRAPRRVTITFQQLLDKDDNAVAVTTLGRCAQWVAGSDWLDDLFAEATTSSPIATASTSTISGAHKTYHWCQYLAGRHVVSPVPRQSARTVVMTIQRRVVAQTVLSYILHELQRHAWPRRPAWSSAAAAAEDNNNVVPTILDWTLVRHDENKVHVYRLVLQPPNSNSRQAYVYVDVVRYPMVPPRFDLSTTATTASTSITYDPAVAELERGINVELLANVSETQAPWLLVRQVEYWMQEVDATIGAGTTFTTTTAASTASGLPRAHKGRDRMPIK